MTKVVVGEAEGTDLGAAKAGKKEKTPEEPRASIKQFYQHASCNEMLLLFVAMICATGTGVAQPMMLVSFSILFEQLGVSGALYGTIIPQDKMLDVLMVMIYIGVAMFVGQFIAIAIVNTFTASQMVKYKQAYLKGVLRQDVGWYDTSNPEELSTQFAEAMVKMQKGFKAQTMIFLGFGYGTGGLAVAFIPSLGNPEVAGVTVATVPLLIIAAVAMMYFVENGTKQVAKAYASAGGIATECLFSIRPIVAFGIEKNFEERYQGALSGVRRTTIVNSSLLMGSAGLVLSSYLVMMGTAIVFGAYRLAYEIESSEFPLTVDGALYPQPSGTTDEVYYCAGTGGALSNISQGTPCQTAFQMTCQLGEVLTVASETPFIYFAAGVPAAQIPSGIDASTTTLEGLGFSSVSSFDHYVDASAPSSYLDRNSGYYPCAMAGQGIIIAIFAVMMMGEGFGMISQPLQTFSLGRAAAAKVIAIISRIPTIDSFSDEGLKPTSVAGNIEVVDVTFAYPTAPDTLVAKNYNLSVKSGQTVALCGPSGSGKSTIIQLIERFYDPQSGVVTLDGVDIKLLNVRWLRSQLGLVSQEPLLFQGTVAQNIGYGKLTEASQAEIEEAAKMANAHSFITEHLGEGYETQVGQTGGKLSGGQKQRVAIARAIIKKPAVLLLDEATSALDTKSEKVVQATLDEIMTKQKRTTIMIAHRLSTIRNANTIAVVSEGAIVEQGTFESLLAIEGGTFQGLAAKQEAMLAIDKESVAEEKESVETISVPTAAVAVAVTSTHGPTEAGAKGEKKKMAKEESAPILRILRMQKEHFPALILMVLFSGAACAVGTYSFYLMVKVMAVVFNSSTTSMREDAVSISIELGIYAVVVTGCFTLSGFFNGLAGSSLTAKLRAKGMSSLLRQEMGWFDEDVNSAAELTAFLAEKVDKVKSITTEQLDLVAQLVGAVISFLVIVGIYSNWRLLLAWIGMIGVMCVIMPLEVAMMKGEDAAEEKKKKGIEDTSKMGQASMSANKIVGDAVFGIRTVASFNLEQKFYDGFAANTAVVAASQKTDALKSGFFQGLSQLVLMCSMGSVFYYSVWLANKGLTDFTEVMAPLFAVMGIMIPMLKAGALADLKNASNAAVRLFAVFDRVPLIDSFSDEGLKPTSVAGNIEVVDVTFAYPTAPDTLVAKGYSLSVPAGKTMALCGPSGSGKSTVISLIERFYDPQSGVVTLDGVDIKTLSVRWLRSQLGLVSQEPLLFQGTVAQNIAHGKGHGNSASQAEIEEAAKMANAHSFITEHLGNGYLTDVGLRGGKLSGGQKQRVAIARAIIKKPAVLLLDEATSALDNESEGIVQAALDEIMAQQKRTTITIAHRLSTIRSADKIAVVSEGAVLEQGTHDELLALHGMYTNLVIAN